MLRVDKTAGEGLGLDLDPVSGEVENVRPGGLVRRAVALARVRRGASRSVCVRVLWIAIVGGVEFITSNPSQRLS